MFQINRIIPPIVELFLFYCTLLIEFAVASLN